MKALKILGIVIAVLILLVAIAIGIVIAKFDGNRIKQELVTQMQEKKQRTLKIDGDLSLGFWPKVSVKIGKLSLSEHASKQQFASVESARVSVAVMPLLSGKVVVDTVELNGANVTLIKHRDGKLNIDDLTSADEKAAPAAAKSAKAETKPLQIDIGGIKIANMQLTWRDEKSGSATTISGLDFSTGRIEADSGKKTYLVNALSLAAKGKLDADSFDIKLQAPKISLSPDKSASDTVTLSAVLSGPQRNVNAKLSLAGIEGKGDVLRIGKLAFDLDASAGEASVKGTLNSALTANFEQQKVAFESIAGEFNIAHPQMPMKQLKLPIKGNLSADLEKQSAAGNLGTQFDESHIALKFNVAKFAPLALGFDLDIDKLNIDKYMPPKTAATAADKAAAEKKSDDTRLDFSALKGLNLDGLVKIGNLQVSNIKAANIKLPIRATGGRLEVAPHSAQLYEGSVTGSLTLNANDNAMTLKENFAGININPLLKDVMDKDVAEGRGNIALNVTSRGATVKAMKKALGGTASLSLKDGAIKGINLEQTLRDMKGAFSGKQDATQQARPADKTVFSELAASFKVANGVAHNDDLTIKAPYLKLGGSGDIDIGNDSINYLVQASVVTTAGGQGAKDLEYLNGVTVPVRLSGPFDKLAYKIEFADIASAALKSKVDEQTKVLKDKFQEQLQNKLQDLFKR